MNKIMTLKERQFLLFFSNFYAFFSCVIELSRIFSTMSTEAVKEENFELFLVLGKSAQYFTIK